MALEDYAASASVTLDIGGGRGALIIYPSARYRGREIEISRAGESRRVHTGVHDRLTGSGSVLTAIFGSLAAGEYDVWQDAHTTTRRVVIADGSVVETVLT